jgi:RNA polymerase sigma factor (sigma-70 family)
MGETATVHGLRHSADRASVLGQSDDDLVAGVRTGEAAAFEEIYDRYARGILAFCAHMLSSREAAEDALQLTFVSAYRSLRAGENSIALRPWLYTIARNRCLSELRARREALGVDELTDRPVFEGLADEVQRREDLREMVDDMQRLPADQRAALVLFELGDHPQKEIATVLGVRTEKVKALVFQAREALVRGRQAREHPCGDIREQLATMEGRVPARSLLRAHIDRCPGCQSYEHEVHHQRAALALILPVALTGALKTSILGSVLHGGGAVAAGVGACGGGGGAIAATGSGGAVAGGGAVASGGAVACGSGAVVGSASTVGGVSAIGGATVGGMGGVGAVSAATAGGVATASAGGVAVASTAPIVAAATGLTAIGESVGVGGLSATGVVAKILSAAAIATVAASKGHAGHQSSTPDRARATSGFRARADGPLSRAGRRPRVLDGDLHPDRNPFLGALDDTDHDGHVRAYVDRHRLIVRGELWRVDAAGRPGAQRWWHIVVVPARPGPGPGHPDVGRGSHGNRRDDQRDDEHSPGHLDRLERLDRPHHAHVDGAHLGADLRSFVGHRPDRHGVTGRAHRPDRRDRPVVRDDPHRPDRGRRGVDGQRKLVDRRVVGRRQWGQRPGGDNVERDRRGSDAVSVVRSIQQRLGPGRRGRVDADRSAAGGLVLTAHRARRRRVPSVT